MELKDSVRELLKEIIDSRYHLQINWLELDDNLMDIVQDIQYLAEAIVDCIDYEWQRKKESE